MEHEERRHLLRGEAEVERFAEVFARFVGRFAFHLRGGGVEVFDEHGIATGDEIVLIARPGDDLRALQRAILATRLIAKCAQFGARTLVDEMTQAAQSSLVVLIGVFDRFEVMLG